MSVKINEFDREMPKDGDVHLSSSSCFSTSPMIWPTLCNALMFSSVWLNSFSRSLISRRRFLSLTSQFRDSSSELV